MIGYREGQKFHLILEGNEGIDLVMMVSEGKRLIDKWKLEEPLKSRCVEESQVLLDKLGVMFVGDNYNPSSKNRRIIARFKKPLKTEI